MTVVTPRVLVVSESRITRRVVEMTFADQPVELVTAVSGQAGLEAWDALPAAVVLADVVMAPPDGLALARHVQATAGSRPAAVLLMAGQSDAIDAAAVAAADVRSVMRKPLDSMQLIDAVREALRTNRPPRAAPAEATADDVARAATAAHPPMEPAVVDAAPLATASVAAPLVLGDADLDRVAARVAAMWSGDGQHEARVQALVAARADDLTTASAAAAERFVRELAPAVVQQVARLVVTDVSERLVREEIARMRSQHQAR